MQPNCTIVDACGQAGDKKNPETKGLRVCIYYFLEIF